VKLVDIIVAESRFVYAGLFRRKSALATTLLYPYVITAFVVLVGNAMGSAAVFVQRVGVDPVPFFIVSSFILMSVMGVVDDIFWTPLFDELNGTLPYIVASPVDRVVYFLAIPIPRLAIVLPIGVSSVVPVMLLYYGVAGLYESLAIMLLAALAALLFTTLAMAITGALYMAGGETWRSLNVIRPLIMVLLGAFYPRWLMPLAARALSWALPPSHVIEVIHRVLVGAPSATQSLALIGVATALALLYTPLGARGIHGWERRKMREGVRV